MSVRGSTGRLSVRARNRFDEREARIAGPRNLVEMKINMDGRENESRQVSIRESVLNEALRITKKDRNTAYGDPEDNFANIAGLWREYLRGKNIESLDAADVAAMMILMKVARLKFNPVHRDSWVDAAGYAACGAQAALLPAEALSRDERSESDVDVVKRVADGLANSQRQVR